MKRIRNIAVAAAVATTAVIAPAVPASAAVPCVTGFVCVEQASGVVTLVPEGQRQTFPSGTIMAGVANATKVNYCVGGNPSFSLGRGTTVERKQPIFSVGPGDFCAL